MRNWGFVITAFYAVIVVLLLTYGISILAEAGFDGLSPLVPESFEFLQELKIALTGVLILVCAQALLLFLSVDSSWRRMKPRRHVKVTASLAGLMVAILASAIFFAIGAAVHGDEFSGIYPGWLANLPKVPQATLVLVFVLLVWAFWGALFYTFSKHASDIVDSAVRWLIRGSVLELLVAVPCHIIVRQRDDCSAPFLSAYGIATGIAIMLMGFGPGVLFLYRRKLGDYKKEPREDKPAQ